MVKTKVEKRIRRIKSIRKYLSGSDERPRISIFRSNNHIYAQVINDKTHKTLVEACDMELKLKKEKPVVSAAEVGKLLGEKMLKNKLKKAVFDRRGYKYHGRVKALAEGIRTAGVEF